MRSRVVPGRSSTSATRPPTSRLKSADLPTLGRPTMATTGKAAPLSAGDGGECCTVTLPSYRAGSARGALGRPAARSVQRRMRWARALLVVATFTTDVGDQAV